MESSQQLVISQNIENQVAIPNQDQQIQSYYTEEHLTKEAVSIPQLQVNVLNEIQRIIKEDGNQNNYVASKILSTLKRTKSPKDLLHNLLVLLPQQGELSESCEEANIYKSLEENGLELKKIIIDLDKLSQEVQSIMKTYKSKLETFKQQIKGQMQSNCDLSVYIKSYCRSYFIDDITKIGRYKKQIEEIDERIGEIQKDRNLLNVHKVSQRIMSSYLITNFLTADSQIILSNKKELDYFNKQEQLLKDEMIKIKQEIDEHQLKIIYSKQQIGALEDQIKSQESYKKKIEKVGKQDFTTQINMEEYFEQKKRDLESYRKQQIISLSQFEDEFKQTLEKEEQQLLKKQQNQQKVGKSYNIIFLIDDSGSMHTTQGVFSFLKKTPFSLLKESILKLIQQRKSQGSQDKISIVKFSTKSFIIHRREDIQTLILQLDSFPQQAGTNFNAAFQDALECIKESSHQRSNILIFQTDGKSDNKDKCESIIEQMKAQDPNMQMFTLAVGDDLDEKFLKHLTLIANNGEEIFAKSSQYSMNYYQKLISADSLSKVFIDISLGISEIMDQIKEELKQQQMRFDKKNLEYSTKVQRLQKEIQERTQQLEEEQKMQLELRNKKEKQQFLETNLNNFQNQIDKLRKEKNELEKEIKSKKNQISILTDKLKHLQEQLSNLLKQFSEKKQVWQKNIDDEIMKNEKYKQSMQILYEKTGCQSELKLNLWSSVANQFEQFVHILSNYTTKFKNFYNKFKDISDNLNQQTISFQNPQDNQISETQQIENLTKIFGHFQDNNQSQQLIDAKNLIEIIFKEDIYLKEDDQEKQKIIKNCQDIILEQFENLRSLLKIVSFNNPIVKKKKRKVDEDSENEEDNDDSDGDDDDDYDDQAKYSKLLLKALKKDHDNQINAKYEELEEYLSPLIKAKAIKKSKIRKIKSQKQFNKMKEKVEEFLDNLEDDSDEDKSSDEEEEESDSSESDRDQKDLKKKKNKKSKKQKAKQNKFINKKQFPRDKDDQIKFLKELKKLGKDLIAVLDINKKEANQMKKCWQILDDRISKTLSRFNLSQKQNQINQLVLYLDQEILQPLYTLIEFQDKSQ